MFIVFLVISWSLTTIPNLVSGVPHAFWPTGQIHQASRADNLTNNRPTVNRVGGFEEVYRWRQMTFTPLEHGK